jgi:hypothetical protein
MLAAVLLLAPLWAQTPGIFLPTVRRSSSRSVHAQSLSTHSSVSWHGLEQLEIDQFRKPLQFITRYADLAHLMPKPQPPAQVCRP